LVGTGGCVSLQPYEAVVEDLPASNLLLIDDHRVHVEVAGSGEPLVMIHGFGGSTYSWRQVMPMLAQDYRVIALDLRGFGFTERPADLELYTRDAQVHLILRVLDELEIDRAHLMAHSYGGGLAMTLAVRHPDRVRSLVLADSTAPDYALQRRKVVAALPPVTWLFTRIYALRPPTVRRVLERAWYDDQAVSPEVVDEYLERLRIEGAARAYRGLSTPLVHEQEKAPITYEDLTVPVLVIWGEDDQLISVEAGRSATERMPRARFVALPDCGHSPMEEQPEAFLRAVEPFLAAPERSVSSTAR
jgi:pimeloyl-ACP methyl ester carboxylesterase